MDQHTTNVLAWGAIFVLFMLGLQIPRLMIKRAISQVIAIFRNTRSLCGENPKTARELGLEQPGFLDRILKPKDYKPYALQALISAGIVRFSEMDGKVCLLEDKLPESLRNA